MAKWKPQPAPLAPVIWRFRAGKKSAYGIFIDEERCWVGNIAGDVFALSHSGKVLRHYRLPDCAMALVGDSEWMYAGCYDGNVYDLSSEIPRLAYEIENRNPILWLDICDGLLAVSLVAGGLALLDSESQVLWSKKGSVGRYMVRIDRDAVYHGDHVNLSAYNRTTGDQLWTQKSRWSLFGCQTESVLYVCSADRVILAFDKRTGRTIATYRCEEGVACCATSPDGLYVFGGTPGHIICFDGSGKMLWELATGCSQPLSMQYQNGLLYVVTTSGYLACVDTSPTAIARAQAGRAAKTREIKLPKEKAATLKCAVPTTTTSAGGVVVECVEEGSALRVRVVSKGYNKDWNVQFPRDIREKGARYVVGEVRKETQGGFYRAIGSIKRLVPTSVNRKRS